MKSALAVRSLIVVLLTGAAFGSDAQTRTQPATQESSPMATSGAMTGGSAKSGLDGLLAPGMSRSSAPDVGAPDRGRTRSFQGRRDRSEPADTRGKTD